MNRHKHAELTHALRNAAQRDPILRDLLVQAAEVIEGKSYAPPLGEGMKAVLANTETAMGHVWMVTEGNSRRDQIAAGGDWLRVNLASTGEGLEFQPLSQALQEYPEMAALYRDTHARLAPNGGTVQMLARIGYGRTVDASPRWPLESKLRVS